MGNCNGSETDRARSGSSLNVRGANQNNRGGAKNKISECKVVILGDPAVGKTSITMRYAKNEFKDTYTNTIGAQFQQPKITLKNGNTLKVNLWDTAGEEKFRSMLSMYYKEAKGVLIAYDISSKDTFLNIEKWLQTLNDHIKKEEAVICLIGNKKDLPANEKEVDTNTARKFAESHGMLFAEVSAKTGDGVEDVFKNLAEELAKKFKY